MILSPLIILDLRNRGNHQEGIVTWDREEEYKEAVKDSLIAIIRQIRISLVVIMWKWRAKGRNI